MARKANVNAATGSLAYMDLQQARWLTDHERRYNALFMHSLHYVTVAAVSFYNEKSKRRLAF